MCVCVWSCDLFHFTPLNQLHRVRQGPECARDQLCTVSGYDLPALPMSSIKVIANRFVVNKEEPLSHKAKACSLPVRSENLKLGWCSFLTTFQHWTFHISGVTSDDFPGIFIRLFSEHWRAFWKINWTLHWLHDSSKLYRYFLDQMAKTCTNRSFF